MQLFYNPNINELTEQLAFSQEESNHIVKVLRKTVGDELQLTNGEGWLFKAEIIFADLKNCIAIVTSKALQLQKNYHVHLAVAPTKMNDRFEWFLEKSTEIGIDKITPIMCDHSERKIVKADRFEKIIQSAMKQSLQYYKPQLNEFIKFDEFIKSEFKGQKFIAHCEDTDRTSLKSMLIPHQNATILIGPEGDFSKREIDVAIESGFMPITLGTTRLRTETAAIVACHTIAIINEL